jgi:peptidyl-prolyl cis-trans isomerase A (cyclophilin A)
MALSQGVFRMKKLALPACILLACAMLTAHPHLPGDQQRKNPVRKPGLYAVFETSMGSFVCELYEKQAPMAVANFVGLVEGTKEWLTPKGDFVKKPFYNGLIFHRVIKKFAIQAGDVTGTGGNFQAVIPFENETVPSLTFDQPGMLAMANTGPKSNITQFFITVGPAANLNGNYTIFGKTAEGYSVVENISNVPVLASKPVKPVTILKVTIERVGKK